jgi:hypothetical protein
MFRTLANVTGWFAVGAILTRKSESRMRTVQP